MNHEHRFIKDCDGLPQLNKPLEQFFLLCRHKQYIYHCDFCRTDMVCQYHALDSDLCHCMWSNYPNARTPCTIWCGYAFAQDCILRCRQCWGCSFPVVMLAMLCCAFPNTRRLNIQSRLASQGKRIKFNNYCIPTSMADVSVFQQ